ncbi:hypothetical protein NA56DRAFT_712877 [Hyaloscypha hepaticicola]|uniref:Uncharacterized protein n=1 Tax=Hyaloscypha hepaticicola TaxID=2082293 RepID=A0A2J6PF76_9HELO|nr:hypothetical protein NA56DRAFT_712877 [Hyaloscypha hepaticicola]
MSITQTAFKYEALDVFPLCEGDRVGVNARTRVPIVSANKALWTPPESCLPIAAYSVVWGACYDTKQVVITACLISSASRFYAIAGRYAASDSIAYTEVPAISLATGRGERQASGRHIGLAQQQRLGARKPEGAPALAIFLGPVRYIGAMRGVYGPVATATLRCRATPLLL